MRGRNAPFLLTLLFAGLAIGAEGSAPTTRPAVVAEQLLRHLEAGSWVVTEAHVKTNGSPSAMKRKVLVTADPANGERRVQEMRWRGEAFVAEGPAVAAGQPDRR